MQRQVLSITQVNEYIRSKLDNDGLLSGIAVSGEISNYKVYPSGHHYFTLKDEGAALKCVMFRSNAIRLKFRPVDGMKIIAMGKISVYTRDGAYQLYCTTIALDGVGDLYAAFEQLKAKLASDGLFDLSHKKPLPKYPGTIGIITSTAGAAVHDMLRILSKRYPLTSVRILPVRVQGAEAPGEITSAIRYANSHRLADLLIVGRGGGSVEDLWAFNDEMVARAIFESEIPVISAVGHEPDVTISDFVADLRAATPSNAAELAVPDQDALRQSLDSVLSSMTTTVLRQLKTAKERFDVLRASQTLASSSKIIEHHVQALKLVDTQLQSALQKNVAKKKADFVGLTAKLDAMSPLKVLTRGYAMVRTSDGNVIHSVQQVIANDIINISVSDGTISATISDAKESSYE